jgi:hypothetical protein
MFLPSLGILAQDEEMSRAYQRATELRANYERSLSRNSPGSKLAFHELDRSGDSSNPRVRYELYVSGLPRDILYDVADWPDYAEKPKTEIIGASLDQDGRVICGAKTPDECHFLVSGRAPIDFTLVDIDPGQPFRFAVFSGPKMLITTADVIPIPIQVQDGKCEIEAIRLMRHFEVARLKLRGFPPSSILTVDGVSYGERHGGNIQSDEAGTADLLLLPFVKGHSAGISEITVTAEGCAPKIVFEWGKSVLDKVSK